MKVWRVKSGSEWFLVQATRALSTVEAGLLLET